MQQTKKNEPPIKDIGPSTKTSPTRMHFQISKSSEEILTLTPPSWLGL